MTDADGVIRVEESIFVEKEENPLWELQRRYDAMLEENISLKQKLSVLEIHDEHAKRYQESLRATIEEAQSKQDDADAAVLQACRLITHLARRLGMDDE